MSTVFGSRWIATFDESDLEVFMPRRFTKDAKNKTLRKKLVFIVRDPQNGLYGDKPYARYMFVIPKRNCCICHIAILFAGDGETDQRRKLENGHCVCEETCRTADSLCTCFEMEYVLSKVNNFEVFRNMLCVKKEEEESESEEESEEESDDDKPQKKKKSKKN